MVICKSCGALNPDDSKFCPKCGRPVAGEAAQGPPRPQRTPGTAGPQDWCGWRDAGNAERRGPWHGDMWSSWWSPGWGEGWVKRWSWAWSPLWIMLNAVFFGLFATGMGVLLFLAAWGGTSIVTRDNVWAYLFILIGVLFFLRGIAQYFVAKRWLWGGGMTGGVVFITLGLAWLIAVSTSWSQYLWAFVIVAGGLVVIALGMINYLWMKATFKK